MCTLAGYIGTKPAAPELLRAARRQEGWWSGFYSGLATAAPNRLHWAKAIGTIAKLERTTPARELPGTVGLVHSRTKSGGGRARKNHRLPEQAGPRREHDYGDQFGF